MSRISSLNFINDNRINNKIGVKRYTIILIRFISIRVQRVRKTNE